MRIFLLVIAWIIFIAGFSIMCAFALGYLVDQQQLLDHPLRFIGLGILVAAGMLCLGFLRFPMGNSGRDKSLIAEAHELAHLRKHRNWNQSDLMVH